MTASRQEILTEVLRKVRTRLQRLQDRKERVGEQNTKAGLIDPILSALGWNLEELEEVSREYKAKPRDNPVDYAFFILRSPRLFVEAKDLDKDLDDRKWTMQTLSYATVVGVQWCVLTNGDEYRIFNSHAAVGLDEKLFRVVRVSDRENEKRTLETLDLLSKEKMGENQIDVLWKAHFVDRKVKGVVEDLFTTQDKGLVRLIRKNADSLSPSEIRSSLKRARLHVDFPLLFMDFEPSQLPHGRPNATDAADSKVRRSRQSIGSGGAQGCSRKGPDQSGLTQASFGA